jgi:ribosomal protein S18 acetylase RimI-like enzyme
MAKARILRAGIEDAELVARIHVAAWRESYASLMPPEALALQSVEQQAERWREIFRGQASDDASAVFLAIGEDGTPCGFGSCGRQRGPRLADAGFPVEFSALYLSRSARRRGVGRALMGVMAGHLVVRGFCSASVWVFRDNPDARLFYEALGGERTGIDGEWTVLGVTLPDMSYGWRDLSKLAAHQ